MTSLAARSGLLRDKNADGVSRVAPVELFFDLVFVFAITQLSHGLLGKLTQAGFVEMTILFLAVWWTWICTSWVTNWLDPDRWPVRMFLFAVMLGGLVMAAAIPSAFGNAALVFAGAHAAILVGRPIFMIWAIGQANPGNRRNFQRILAWALVSAVFWIAGALADGPVRLALWIVAVLMDYGPAWFGFRFPGLGASTTADWDIDGHHLSERCALFVIIALGESLLITGTTAQKLPVSVATVSAFLSAFVATVAMWWLYFAIGAERSTHHIAHSDDPGRLARSGYTYWHIVIVGGIIVAAVADELVLAHPTGHVAPAYLLAIVGAPALFLLGNAAFKRLSAGNLPLSHLVGLGLLAGTAASEVAGHVFSPLGLSVVTTLVLVVTAVWEWLSLHGGKNGSETGTHARR